MAGPDEFVQASGAGGVPSRSGVDRAAKQQFRGFGAFLFIIGVVLLGIAVIVGFSAHKDNQLVAAGALVGLPITAGLCFVASAIIYLADRPRQP